MSQPTETNALEVRWFGDGPPPEPLREWFGRLGDADAGSRTDLYLAPTDAALNLKLRDEGDGFVEVKRRLGAPVSRTVGGEVDGHVEQWYKWSFSLDERAALRARDPTGLWVPVQKSRLLHRLDGDDASASGVAGPTAHVELTAVTTPTANAWTVGVEVAGPAAELEPAFDAAVATVFAEPCPAALTEARSVGYAAWLDAEPTQAGADPAVLVPSRR
ncbi:hypothetical protein N0B31_09575 [Salinirubellus salinus]|uniref:Uncharacterized protein n=1 Tax=Salinirubellus salinus TaxID=1364945 RepID=A0A9E7UD15_9EURY|nr:hypothetical protein [Salinirubellus salinus]UWM56524.1 hypothetical protein N0B31_09575 [Salinirubellus salinus]